MKEIKNPNVILKPFVLSYCVEYIFINLTGCSTLTTKVCKVTLMSIVMPVQILSIVSITHKRIIYTFIYMCIRAHPFSFRFLCTYFILFSLFLILLSILLWIPFYDDARLLNWGMELDLI